MRLIDADKFEAVLICGTEGHEDTFDDGICYMLNRIDEAPTIDAEPVKHGHWIDRPTGRYGKMQSWCSVCGEHSGIGGIVSNRHKPRCPNCGAKMDEEEEK